MFPVQNAIFQAYSRKMLGSILCLLMLILFQNLKRHCLFYLSANMYLICTYLTICLNSRVLGAATKRCSTKQMLFDIDEKSNSRSHVEMFAF